MIAVVATRKGVMQNQVNSTLEGASGGDGGGSGGGNETVSGGDGDDTLAGGNDTVQGGDHERESAMEAIARRNDEAIAQEHEKEGLPKPGGAATAAPAPDKTGDDTTGGGSGDDQLAVQTGDDDVLSADDLSRKTIRLKVNGQEVEVSGADVVRAAQKGKAADSALEEANKLLREVRALTPGATPAPPVGGDAGGKPGNTPATPAPGGGSEVDASGRREFLTTLFQGDEEKAMEALNKILDGRAGGSTQTEAELIAKITPAVRQQLERESALDSFATTHRDLLKDTRLSNLADDFLVEVQAEKPELTFAEHLEEAAQRTYKFTNRKPPTVKRETGSTTKSDRLDAKRKADQTVGASARAAETEPEAETPSSVIAQMRKDRGMEP